MKWEVDEVGINSFQVGSYFKVGSVGRKIIFLLTVPDLFFSSKMA